MHHEIARLEALLAAAERNPLSCPRDRRILESKILDLETERARIENNLDRLRTKAVELAAVADLDAKRERVERKLDLLRIKITDLELAVERSQSLRVKAARVIELAEAEQDAQDYSDSWDLRLWELEAQIGAA